MNTWRLYVVPLSISLGFAACGSGGFSGEYGGDECVYDKLDFRANGNVYITVMGMEQSGEYKVDGDKVSLVGPGGASLVFTRNGDVLEAGIMGEIMRCEKL